MKDNEYINEKTESVPTLFDGIGSGVEDADTVSDGKPVENAESVVTEADEPYVTDSAENESTDEQTFPVADADVVINEDAYFSDSTSDTVDAEESSEVITDESTDAEDGIADEYNESDRPQIDVQFKNDDEGKTVKKERRVDSLFDFIEIFVFTLAAVFIITSFFFRYSVVNGGSMKNTLQHNERLLLTNLFYNPKGGDIVVVQDKSTALKDPIVKRVIAVGGERVKVTKTAIYVNGVELNEDYVYTGDAGGDYNYSVYPSEALARIVTAYEEGVYYEITVPKNEIFVMGDHRNDSTDSRKIGTLHEDAIIGKVVLRFYPFEKFGKVD